MFFDSVEIQQDLNKKWRQMYNSKKLTIPKLVFNRSNNVFFCIGSCFAEYVRQSLESQLQLMCYPDYGSMDLDKVNELADTLNTNSYHMNHYTSASIKQEFARALGILQEDMFSPIEVVGLNIDHGKKIIDSNSSLFQDPYRREVFARDQSSCKELSKRISATVLSGIHSSNTFIITLGLIELFVDKGTGLSFNQFPGYAGAGYSSPNLKFYRATYEDVVNDLNEIILMIKKVDSDNKIIFSVSPVPLQMTFTNEDVFTANTYSKSVLRAAVQQVINNEQGVYYFPSFEIASNFGSDFFQERDLRHAKHEFVDIITSSLFESVNDAV